MLWKLYESNISSFRYWRGQHLNNLDRQRIHCCAVGPARPLRSQQSMLVGDTKESRQWASLPTQVQWLTFDTLSVCCGGRRRRSESVRKESAQRFADRFLLKRYFHCLSVYLPVHTSRILFAHLYIFFSPLTAFSLLSSIIPHSPPLPSLCLLACSFARPIPLAGENRDLFKREDTWRNRINPAAGRRTVIIFPVFKLHRPQSAFTFRLSKNINAGGEMWRSSRTFTGKVLLWRFAGLWTFFFESMRGVLKTDIVCLLMQKLISFCLRIQFYRYILANMHLCLGSCLSVCVPAYNMSGCIKLIITRRRKKYI